MPMKMAKNHGKDIEVEAVANTVQSKNRSLRSQTRLIT